MSHYCRQVGGLHWGGTVCVESAEHVVNMADSEVIYSGAISGCWY